MPYKTIFVHKTKKSTTTVEDQHDDNLAAMERFTSLAKTVLEQSLSEAKVTNGEITKSIMLVRYTDENFEESTADVIRELSVTFDIHSV